MSCAHCITARQDRLCGLYRADCTSCRARSIARSPAMHHAATARTEAAAQALRGACATALPEMTAEQARGEVMGWWRFDHPAPARAFVAQSAT